MQRLLVTIVPVPFYTQENPMTKDEILSMAKEAGIGILYEYDGPDHAGVCDWKDIERFAALVAEKEREACAKVCEQYKGYGGNLFAPAIRARNTIWS
jgi:hypothetical protein